MQSCRRGVEAPEALMNERARVVAGRMLSGVGAASVCLFREEGQPVLDALAHGALPDGTVVVATVQDLPGEASSPGSRHDIRLEITQESPEAGIRITAASVHLLGSLTWLSASESAGLLGDLPEAVASLAHSPSGKLGLMSAESVLVHDVGGVRRLSMGALALGPVDALQAMHRDWACGLSHDVRADLVSGVMDGSIDGFVISSRPSGGAVDGIEGSVFVIDADASWVTLMRVDGVSTDVVVARASAAHAATPARRPVTAYSGR